MIMDLFTLRLGEGEYKYLINNNNGLIHLLPERGEYKYSIHDDNGFIHLPSERKRV